MTERITEEELVKQRKLLQNRRVVFKTLFGSKLYGTSTPESDIDWKEVYLPSLGNMLIGKHIQNIVNNTKKSTEKRRNSADDIDYEYIPVQQFAIDFINGQTYALELAFSALSESNHAQQEHHTDWFKDFVSELSAKFLTNNIKKMTGYALNQAQIYGIKGTRLSTLLKFSDYIKEGYVNGSFVPTDKLDVLVDWVEANTDKYLRNTTYKNHDMDFPCIELLGKIYPLGIYVNEAMTRCVKQQSKYGVRAQDAADAKGMDWKATAHAVRIIGEAIELLETGKLLFPFSQDTIDHLLTIRSGVIPEQEVKNELTTLIDIMDDAKLATALPEYTDEMYKEFEDWLKAYMIKIYEKYSLQV